MNATSIEWVKNLDGSQGYTWNPITGCLNGCEYCYARKLANGRLRSRYLANKNFATPKGSNVSPAEAYQIVNDPFYPRFWEERIPKNYHIPPQGKGLLAKGLGIFVCDMGELFGDWVPRQWQEEIFKVIRNSPDCRFYLLTKQPQNLIKFSPFPENCWVGVTATTYKQFQDALEGLCQIVAKVKYISFEPLLESIEIWHSSKTSDNDFTIGGGIDWVIIGAQTKPYKPPKIEWVEEIVKACDKAGVPVFLKDNLLELVNYEGKETEFAFNKDGFYRQEIPD